MTNLVQTLDMPTDQPNSDETKMVSLRLPVRLIDALKEKDINLTATVRAHLEGVVDGMTLKKAFSDAVLVGVQRRRQALGIPWHEPMPARADGRPHNIKVVLRDGSAVYFHNIMTDVSSPSIESPLLRINGTDEAGQPRHVEGHVGDMTLVFD